MLFLLTEQFERVGFLIAMAFLFSRMQKLRHFMHYQEENKNIWLFILLLSFFAILGTYSGLPVTGVGYRETPWIYKISGWEAIASARTIGIVIAGLFGGIRAGICRIHCRNPSLLLRRICCFSLMHLFHLHMKDSGVLLLTLWFLLF